MVFAQRLLIRLQADLGRLELIVGVEQSVNKLANENERSMQP